MFFRFSKNYALWDTIFIIAIAGYTLFGLWGVSLLSCDGLKISSDLCCYVQIWLANCVVNCFHLTHY